MDIGAMIFYAFLSLLAYLFAMKTIDLLFEYISDKKIKKASLKINNKQIKVDKDVKKV